MSIKKHGLWTNEIESKCFNKNEIIEYWKMLFIVKNKFFPTTWWWKKLMLGTFFFELVRESYF